MKINNENGDKTEMFSPSEAAAYNIPPDLLSRASGSDAIILLSVWSNPYISIIGVTANAVSNIANYTQIPARDVDDALRRLDKAGEVVFDPDTQEVMALGWMKYNHPSNSASQDGEMAEPDMSGMPFSQTLKDYFADKKPNHLFRAGFWLKGLGNPVLDKMVQTVCTQDGPNSDLLLLSMSLISAESGKQNFAEVDMQGAIMALAKILILERLVRDGLFQIEGHIHVTKPVKASLTKKGVAAKINASPSDLISMVESHLPH